MLPLVAEAEYIHIVPTSIEPRKLPGKVFDMNASSPVRVGRILIGEESNFHEPSPDNASFSIYPFIEPLVKSLKHPGILGRFPVS
jgi:hypothetical protein